MENEINQARSILYGLIRSFFDSPPDDIKLKGWKDILLQLSGNTGYLDLDLAVENLLKKLKSLDLNQIGAEYYELFENPFSSNRIQLCASFYIDGRLFGQSLVKLRQLLYNLNLGRSKSFAESEDNFVFLLDTMTYLIQKGDEYQDLLAQKELFYSYLYPCSKGIAKKIQELSGFPFYKGVSKFIDGYFLLEEHLFP